MRVERDIAGFALPFTVGIMTATIRILPVSYLNPFPSALMTAAVFIPVSFLIHPKHKRLSGNIISILATLSAFFCGLTTGLTHNAMSICDGVSGFTSSTVTHMLAGMKAKLTAARTLLYETTRAVDLRTAYTHLAEAPDATAEVKNMAKYYNKLAAILTPMCKALATESANQIAYDTIQIHGGTGFMRDFNAERFYRDALITNIYEGTTQLQVVAAIGGVMQRDADKRLNEMFDLKFEGESARLAEIVKGLYAKQLEAVKFVADRKDIAYHDLHARDLVEMETYVFVGMLMLRDAQKCADRFVLAERYILDSQAEFAKRYAKVMSGDQTVIERHRDVIDY